MSDENLDSLAVILNCVLVALTLVMAKIGINVGRNTGNLFWWTMFTAGWLLIGIARSFTVLTYTGLLESLEPEIRNISTFTVIIAIFLMMYGMYNFSRIIEKRGRT